MSGISVILTFELLSNRNCGEMSKSAGTPVCMGEQKILYAWALDAPPLELPEGKEDHRVGEGEHLCVWGNRRFICMGTGCPTTGAS